MKRRDFITGLGSAAALAAGGARAAGRAGAARRRVHSSGRGRPGVTSPQRGVPAGLAELGWTVGRNVRIDFRWAAGDADNIRKYAAELVALAPDVILGAGNPMWRPLLQATRTLPIVFAGVADPVGAGFVQSLARPGGNATGFIPFEFSISGKWLELLKEIAPSVTRVAVLRDRRPSFRRRTVAAQSRPWRHRSGWNCAQSVCATPARSNAA